MSGSSITRVAGIAGTFTYTLNTTPFSAPVMNIYSDAARTTLAQGPDTLAATADPNKFTATYGAGLVAGTYYLTFSTVFTAGEPALDDADDTLILTAAGGSVAEAYGLCSNWAAIEDLCPPCDDSEIYSDTLMNRMLTVSSELLFQLSGRIFPGICTKTVRPCAQTSPSSEWRWWDDQWTTWSYDTWRDNSRSIFLNGCSCNRTPAHRQCGCCRLSEIQLSSTQKVRSVEQVTVDGVEIASSRYRIDDFRWLVRLPEDDGTNDGWPCCQDLELATSEDDTFSVVFTLGSDPPEAGKLAAASLACELARGCTGGDCIFPSNAITSTRQGITIQFRQLRDTLESRLTGIYNVDLFLASYAPPKGRTAGGIMIPGKRPRFRRTNI